MIKLLRRSKTCLYEVLGVERSADKEAIKQAYYGLARTHHPDVADSTRSFSEISLAYETLIDEDRRYAYDLEEGYLNALDIDRMEQFKAVHGTRYPAQWQDLADLDIELGQALERDPWVLPKFLYRLMRSPDRSGPSESWWSLENPSTFRWVCLCSATVGTAVWYKLFILAFEAFV